MKKIVVVQDVDTKSEAAYVNGNRVFVSELVTAFDLVRLAGRDVSHRANYFYATCNGKFPENLKDVRR